MTGSMRNHLRPAGMVRSVAPVPGWAGLPIKKAMTVRSGPQPPFLLAKPLLGVILCGEHDSSWRQCGIAHTRRCSPGSFTLLNAPAWISELEEHAGAEHLLVEIDLDAYEAWSGRRCPPTSFPAIAAGDDGPVASLVAAMQDEVARGCPSGPLYGRSLSIALVSYLEGRFSTYEPKAVPPGLSATKLRRLQDHILGNLDRELSLSGLAELADLSPQHLCRSFKKAAGVTPYRYVLDARIHRAKEILTAGRFPIADVALAVGFSSQSHFSDTFRRVTGVSPRQFQSIPLPRRGAP